MLLFISGRRQSGKAPGMFQYISCYSLSLRPAYSTLERTGFNTSHVTLYRGRGKGSSAGGMFQYISCYSLSEKSSKTAYFRGVSIHLMLLFIAHETGRTDREYMFQYISCYSLSQAAIAQNIQLFQVSIHLMLLFIEITIQNQFGFQYSFNTSHVTLYRKSGY